MSKKSNDKSEQLSLFTPVMGEITAAKDQIDLMAYPFFSLSKQKRTTPIQYDDGRVKVTVTGQEQHGIANIYDADILIYVASQLMSAKNKGQETSRRIKMSRYDILEFLKKGTGGIQYKRLKESLERLQSTSVSTTITREGSRFKKYAMFSWISEWRAIENNNKPIAIEFELNQWLYEGIIEGKVLTLPHKYFRIESGLERFLYRLCRKVIGIQKYGELKMKLDTVHKRSGITRKPGAFKKMIEKIVMSQSIPDYWIFLVKKDSTEDYVCGLPRDTYESKEKAFDNISTIVLSNVLNKEGT